jgi:predicted nucleic acid-binding protein
MAVLVDSSLWVHQLRKSGDVSKRDRVNALLASGLAAWCPPVRLELWRGVTNDGERRTLRHYETTDLLIFACAKVHGLDLAHDDTHFDQLTTLER